jgi:signal transduction protein with GAF and PtsI domain
MKKESGDPAHEAKHAYDAIKKSDKEAMAMSVMAQRERDDAVAEELKTKENTKNLDASLNKAIHKAEGKQAVADAAVREVNERAEKEIAKFNDPKRGDITQAERENQ